MHHDPVPAANPGARHPRPADASPYPDRDLAIEVESVVTGVVMIGLMCFTGALFLACFDLVTIA